jgi:YfiH family protein
VDHERVKELRVATIPALDAVPGLVHGFERRLGPSGHETRDASRTRVAAALESTGRLLLLTQVHGCAIETAPWAGHPEADAGMAEGPGLLVGVETADCLPVLLVDPRRRAVAAVHAGWRGTADGIATRAVRALVTGGSDPGDLLAALGPGIGPCCYEVGDELRAAFGYDAEAVFRRGPRGKPHLDVRLANKRQLWRSDVRPENVHSVDECTYCRADLYHSFRRDGKRAGRMINYAGWRA